MAKNHEAHKESRKKPQKSLKERRAEKRAKGSKSDIGEIHVV